MGSVYPQALKGAAKETRACASPVGAGVVVSTWALVSADGREADAAGRDGRVARRADADRGARARRKHAGALGRAPAGAGGHAAGAAAAPAARVVLRGSNYRSHAAELATTVFRDAVAGEQWPIVFTKYAECVIGPYDTVRMPGRTITEQIDYESRARRRDRARRARHRSLARDGPRVRLHDRQRRQRARRAGAPSAVGSGQELRHLLPDGPVDRQRRRARRTRHARARLGQRRIAPGPANARPDLRHPTC